MSMCAQAPCYTYLLDHKLGGNNMHTLYAQCVLCCQCSENTTPIASKSSDSLQIRLDAGTA